jgi:hypothetical protein
MPSSGKPISSLQQLVVVPKRTAGLYVSTVGIVSVVLACRASPGLGANASGYPQSAAVWI